MAAVFSTSSALGGGAVIDAASLTYLTALADASCSSTFRRASAVLATATLTASSALVGAASAVVSASCCVAPGDTCVKLCAVGDTGLKTGWVSCVLR